LSNIILKIQNLWYKLKKYLNKILNIFFPVYCIGCNKHNTVLCENCLYQIPLRLNTRILNSGLKIYLTSGYSIPMLKKSIIKAKYYYNPELFVRLTNYALKILKNLFLDKKAFLLPVPLHYLRKQKRGFNQSAIIAETLSDNFLNLEVLYLVKRIKNTNQQAKKNKNQRINNIKDAFQIDKSYLDKIDKNIYIFIVDDVISTGLTVMEVEKILRDNGFKNIFAFALCNGGR
jgi:ComF family protein